MNTLNPSPSLPRFSVRTLITVVTLICLYFGAWELTKLVGTRAVAERIETNVMNPADMTCQAPFLVSTYSYSPDVQASTYPQTQGPERRHFVWMIGPVVPLPESFSTFVERIESKWHAWTGDGYMQPIRVHGGVI